MYFKKAHLIILFSGLFLLLDQFLKWQAMHSWNTSRLFWQQFGWEPFANYGVAFSLPIPNQITILITMPIIFLVSYLFFTEWRKPVSDLSLTFAWFIILAGAISNFTDRVLYSFVVDYFKIFTAVINLADIMIVFGLAIYVLKLYRLKK